MSNLTISIITPSYNQAAYLEQTIQSVLNQKYPKLEYIVIDGGSMDGSVEILKRYTSRIAFWVSEKDKGQSDAINKGLTLATGDIVCWLNSDDQFEPNTLSAVAKFFSDNPDAQFLYGDGVIFHENGKKPASFCRPGKIEKEILTRCDPLQQPSTFWRRSVHDKVGFIDESLNFTMDWDFFMRISQSYEMHYLPITFSRYRIHEGHKTGSGAQRRTQEVLEFIEKYSNKDCIEAFRAVHPNVADLRRFKEKYGWRIGRLVFCLRHIDLVIKYRRLLRFALDTY